MTTSWLIVAGDFRQTGGMDRANYHLAWHIADRLGQPVSLVAHSVAAPLAGHPNVTVHLAPRPFGAHLLGEPFLDRLGRRVAVRLRQREPRTRVVVNGGNCLAGGVNWVHYLHAAYRGAPSGSWPRRAVGFFKGRRYRKQERRALARAPLVIVNSERTRQDVIEHLGLPPAQVRVVYLASAQAQFRPPIPEERAAARSALGWPAHAPFFLFVGSPRDRRKGLDVVLSAWRRLAESRDWDAHLAVIGAGAEDRSWQAKFGSGMGQRIHCLKMNAEIHRLYWASDAMVSPTRYEPYGLAVHEALCCGVPALVSRTAGVAELYPPELADLLIRDPEDVADLVARLRRWRLVPGENRQRIGALAERLRNRTWERVAEEFVRLVESAPQYRLRCEHQP